MPLSFRLLGPLEAWEDDRQISLGTGRQRALLAFLLVHANEVVSSDRLLEELWTGKPPPSAQKVLQGYVSQLRRVLPPQTIVTQGPGYVLAAGETDAHEFAQLVDQASTLEAGDAAPLLRRALGLWRGRPFAEFEYEDWAQAEIARLEEQRLAAVEERIDADLQLGRHGHVVSELERLVAEHPLRERLRGQLMLALYRSGRQADALESFRLGRRALVELGLEPSPALERLEKQILNHDEALAAPPRRLPVPSALARRGRLLAIAGALVLAGAVATAAWEIAGGSGSTPGAATGNAVVGIDPANGRIVARIAVGKTPSGIVAGAGSVWAASADEETVTRIDPRRGRIVSTSRIGTTPIDLTVGAGSLWLVNGRSTTGSGLVASAYPDSVSRLDLGSSVVTRTVSLPRASVKISFSGGPPGANTLAFTDGGVWSIDPDQNVSRIDASTGRVVATIRGLGAQAIGASGHSVWVDDGYSTLVRIDTRSNRVTARIPLAASSLNGIAVGDGAVWIADAQDGIVWRVDPEPRPVTRTISVGIGVTAVSFGGGAVWASNSFLGTVSRIDPATNTVTRTVDVVGTPQNVSADDRGVWVSVTGTPGPGPKESGVEVLPAAMCGPVVTGGGTARFLIASDLPLRGGAAATLPMTRAIQLVLERHHFRAGAYTVGYQSCDDSTAQSANYDFGTCGANAKAYARDADLIGVIGPFNSPCALAEIPLTNRGTGEPVAMISPQNTNPALTHPGSDLRALLYPTGRRNYVRIIAPDNLQGAAHALLAHQLGLRRVYVLDDDEDFARSLLDGFGQAARKLGLHLVGTAHWNPDGRSSGTLVDRVARTHPDGVVLAGFGGPSAFRLVHDLRARLGAHVALIAGDGFLTIPDLLRHAGPSAEGMYVSFAGRPNELLPVAGKAFVRAFAATQSNRDTASYAAAYGAQAAEVLLAAIARSDGTRGSVTRELFASKIRGGILGDFSFTREGDMTPSPVTIFRVVGGHRRSSTFLEDFAGSVVDRVIDVPAILAR